MSTTDDGTTDGGDDLPTISSPRACPNCEGFGKWEGDRSRGELVVHCTSDDCTTSWTAPDRSD